MDPDAKKIVLSFYLVYVLIINFYFLFPLKTEKPANNNDMYTTTIHFIKLYLLKVTV